MLGAVVAIGSFGYVLIEGVDIFKAFYQVAITVSTVGFQEEFERLVVVGVQQQVEKAAELLKSVDS